jgi:hypothetical protein
MFRLDVAVDDAGGVGVLQCVRDFARDAYGGVHRELTFALESAAERFSSNVRHPVKQEPVGITAVQQRQNVRMLQPRRRPDLGEKTLATYAAPTSGWRTLMATSRS